MQAYRCKCGEAKYWGSFPPSPCQGCYKCNTTLAQHPDYHQAPEPHQWVTRYKQNTGEPYEICKDCMMRRVQHEEKVKANQGVQ